MCLASSEPGGPRRCSGDTRATYQRRQAAVDGIEAARARLSNALASHDPAATYHAAHQLPAPDRDRYLAELSPLDVEDLARALNDDAAPEVDRAWATTPDPALSCTERDTSINTMGEITICRPGRSDTVETAAILDANTAIYHTRNGSYAVGFRLNDQDGYTPIAVASTHRAAASMANRIPVLDEFEPPAGGLDDLEHQCYRAKADAAMELATQAAKDRLGTRDEQSAFLEERLDTARNEIIEAAGATPMRAEVNAATARHRLAQREAIAHRHGEAARAAAQAAGDPDPDGAYRHAYDLALGTPTRGGAHVPHFAHQNPPASLSRSDYDALCHSGIRAYGAETRDDYTVFASRGPDLTAWGINTVYGTINTPDIKKLSAQHARFVNKTLSDDERTALRTYTSGQYIGTGAYIAINAALTGRDANPSPSVRTTVAHLESALHKFRIHNTNTEPATVVRGTSVPGWWDGSREQYLGFAFPVGSKVELNQLTSASTRTATAVQFSTHNPNHYLMVIRTRDGLPVKSISARAGENEVIVPPGTALRCVHIAERGLEQRPTVYLVAEDLVAEADAAATAQARQAS